MELFVLDLGNRQTKLKTQNAELTLPSYFVEASNFGDRGIMNFAKQQRDTHDYNSQKDGNVYVWGSEIDLEYTDFITDTLAFGLERYQSLDFKLLVDFALARLAVNYESSKKGILDVNVVTGVPTKDYINEAISEAIKAAIKGDHVVTVDEEKVTVRVHDVYILPQSLGTVINEVTNTDGEVIDSPILETSIGVVDLGGGTVLVDVLNKMNVDTKKRKQSSHGAYMLYEAIANKIAEKYGHNVSEYEVERIVRAGNKKEEYYLSLDGIDDLSITKEVIEARELYTQNIIKEVRAALKTTERISQILVTGGTANLLIKSEFTKAFPTAKFVENSEFANANGFYKFGLAEGLV